MSFAEASVVILSYVYPIFSLAIFREQFRRYKGQQRIGYLGLLALLNGLVISILILYGYGIGWIFALPSFLVVFGLGILAILLLFRDRRSPDAPETVKQINTYALSTRLTGIVIAVSFVLIPFVANGIEAGCDTFHRYNLKPVIEGLEKYKSEHGLYVRNWSMLVPDYIQAIPSTPPCLRPYDWVRDDRAGQVAKYTVEQCETDMTISFRATDFDSLQVYSFATRQWRNADWLDGCTCDCANEY